MSVYIEIPTILRSYTGGQRSVAAVGEHLTEILADLDRRYPGLQDRIVTSDGKLRRFINIYINDNDVRYEQVLDSRLTDGDVVSIIPAVAGGAVTSVAHDLDEPWLVADGEEFRSRLLIGIEQYKSAFMVGQVLEASGSDVFITTIDPSNERTSLLLSDVVEELPARDFRWIGTTSFARSADEALKTARTLRDRYGINVMKLDVRSEGNRPDNAATIKATETLRAEGMEVLPFILPNVADARALAGLGSSAIRLMAAPVGSGRGIPRPRLLREIIEQTDVPVVVEGGLGTARHVTLAMELGAAAVLVNTALVRAANPVLLAEAMKYAVRAGLLGYRSGPMEGDPALEE